MPGLADEYFQTVYADYGEKDSTVGIAGLLNDKQSNLIPKNLERYNKREKYHDDPKHATIKDNRARRDTLKEKKFQAQSKSVVDANERAEEIQ